MFNPLTKNKYTQQLFKYAFKQTPIDTSITLFSCAINITFVYLEF